MKKSTDVLDLMVISLAEGKKIGKIREVVIDTEKRALAGFLIQSGDWFKINGLPFSTVQSIGEDAVVIANANDVIDASQIDQMEALLSKHVPLKDCSIFSKAGRIIGTVVEVNFDEQSGELKTLEIQTPEEGAVEEISVGAVVTFGQNILIIDESKKKVTAEFGIKEEYIEEPVKNEIPEEVTEEPEPEEEEVVLSADDEAEESISEEVSAEEPEELATAVEEVSVPEEESEEKLDDLFAKKQVQLLRGKILTRDISSEDGAVVAPEGSEVDDDIIKAAIDNKKLVELMVSVRDK